MAACLDAPVTGPLDVPAAVSDPAVVHGWTVILRSDSGADSGAIAIAQTDTAGLGAGPGEYQARARLWTVLDSAPTDSELTLSLSVGSRTLRWRLERDGMPVGSGGGALWTVDRWRWLPRARGRGRATWNGTSVPVHFAALGGVPMPERSLIDPMAAASVTMRARGMVSLRVDDCSVKDSATFGVLRDLHLVAEFGVPSRFVDRPGLCSLTLLRALAAAGNAIESHSRHHARPPTDFAQFYVETVGAARDLHEMGFDPHVFIQPGSWNAGPFDFNSRAKLQGAAGALLRRIYVATEAYAYPDTTLILPARGRIGPPPLLLRMAPEQIALRVRQAATAGRWIEFMWHSWEIPADSLRPRLAAIAALRDSGLVEVMPFYRALHAAGPGMSPMLLPPIVR
jgi:hypothetical protein